MDKLDDCLGTAIFGADFAPNRRSPCDIRNAAVLESEVQVQDGECVQQLALVLMQALDLNVEDGIRVDLYALFFCDICGKLSLSV